MFEYKLPFLGADMESGILREWKVEAGDEVHRGDVVAVIETDKATVDLEIWKDGIISKILVEPNTKVPVGTTLALLDSTFSNSTQALTKETISKEASSKESLINDELQTKSIFSANAETKPISPTELTFETNTISILKDENSQRIEPRLRIKKAMAKAMTQSKREIPHYYLSYTIDMTQSLHWLEKRNASKAIADRMIYAVLLIKSVALACQKVPELNGFWKQDDFIRSENINIGMGISLKKEGLIAPAILNANKKN